MGIEKGTLDVSSYFDALDIGSGRSARPMELIRWWFAMHYDAVHTVGDRTVFEIRGPSAKVLSENELLTRRGGRKHTGTSSEPIARFAHRFTRHFSELARKFPIYAELENIFDLALITSLIRHEDLPRRVDWPMTHFQNPQRYQVRLGHAPQMVDTVVNHRVINRVQIVAGVSGGVHVDPHPYLKADVIRQQSNSELQYQRDRAAPGSVTIDDWWWDAR